MAKASQYLKLIDKKEQPVLGECIDDDHQNEIDLSSWTWSVADPAALPKNDDTSTQPDDKTKTKVKAEGEADSKIAPTLLTFTKKTDRSTVRLINAMDVGEIFPTATLVIEEEFEESPSPFYLEINLTNVLVVRFDLSVDAGSHGTEFKETWDLNYSKIKFSYLMRGQQQGTTDMEFDRPLNSGATASKKAPLTAAEEADRKKKEFDDYMKTQAKKTGK